MAVYTKSMMEALAEVRLQEDNMDLMRKAAGGAMQTIKMKDGKLKMDSFTASGIMQVYDKVNPKNKKAMEQMINSGKKSQIMKLQALALKAGYNEEVELDEAVGAWTIKMPPAEGGNRVDSVSTHSVMGFIKSKGGSNRDIQAIKKGNDVTFQGTTGAFYKITKEEAELDEGPVKSREKTVNMVHKTSGKEVVIVATAKNIKDQEKLGFRTQDNPKDVMKAIKANDKLGIGEQVAEQLSKIRGNTPLKEDENEAYELGTDEYREYLEKLTPGEVDEASARADAMKAMRRGKEVDPADVDVDASDADVKAASKNILAQMRKASNLGGRFEVEFLDKKKVKVKLAIANAFIKKYEGMRKPADKEKLQNQAIKSYKDLLKVLKAGYNEEVEIDEAKDGFLRVTFKNPAEVKKAMKFADDEFGYRYFTVDKARTRPEVDYEGDKEELQRLKKAWKDAGFKFEIDLEEEVELDEALPSHLKKHFDKDGNPKSKEGKAAWERLATSKGYRKYTSQQIKMAIGVAFDKRYVQGNMTGAAKVIEKIAKGLSEIEPVANALRRANENTILDRIDRKLKERKNG